MEKGFSPVRAWVNFLRREKLDMNSVSEADVVTLLTLGGGLATRHPTARPFRSYQDRIKCRRLVCELAIDLKIDLTAIRHRTTGKVIAGRGLLDVWRKVYAEKFGSDVGTAGWFETKRRDIKTKLSKEPKT